MIKAKIATSLKFYTKLLSCNDTKVPRTPRLSFCVYCNIMILGPFLTNMVTPPY